jgi:3-(3-hydroxy-phenyl)propionate hydroxylase
LRNAVLDLAPKAEFARRMINSGRLSMATIHDSGLSTPDEDAFGGSARLGAPIPDAPVRTRDGRDAHLLEKIAGKFTLLHVKNGARPPTPDGVAMTVIGDDLIDRDGMFAQRFDATPGATFLLRPDQHLCARWRAYDSGKIAAGRARALGRH